MASQKSKKQKQEESIPMIVDGLPLEEIAQKLDIENVSTIEKWLKTFMRRFFTQQFKRSALPDGPKVGSVSLSPRGDWKMPSDAAPWNIILQASSQQYMRYFR